MYHFLTLHVRESTVYSLQRCRNLGTKHPRRRLKFILSSRSYKPSSWRSGNWYCSTDHVSWNTIHHPFRREIWWTFLKASDNRPHHVTLERSIHLDTQLWFARIPKQNEHDDVIKWKHLPRYWPFVRGIHRPPVNSPHKGQWRGALMFSLIWV